MNPKKILALCLPGLGDTLMFTPALKLLRTHFPQAQITALVMYRSSYEVLQRNPHLDDVILWEFLKQGSLKSLKFMLTLRREHWDVSIMAFPANRLQYNMVSFLAGARLRLAHQYKHQNLVHLPFLNHRTILEDDELHNVEENLRLLQLLGIDTAGVKPALEIHLDEDDKRYAESFWAEHHLSERSHVFAFHVWSTTLKKMHRKCWDKAKFAALLDRLQERFDGHVLLFEGPHDREVNEFIVKAVRQKPILVKGTSVGQSAAILQKCSLLVSNDSGVMHVGAAVGVPLVAIFGPTNSRWVGPISERCRLVKKDLPCQPCFIYSTRHLECSSGRNFECLATVEVDEVMAAVEELLSWQR